MEIEQANSIKIAIKYLNEDPNGQALLDFLDGIGGKYSPNYNRENSTSVILASGRAEVMQTLRNLERLTSEQIVEYLEGQIK